MNSEHNVNYGWNNVAFADLSWSEIDTIGATGKASDCFSVHDTKDITVGSETLTMEIVGFNHDDLTSGGKAPYSLACKNLMANVRQMNTSSTNVGSFTGSGMYNYLNTDVYNALPADLKTVIKPVNKKTSAGNQSSAVNTESMKIWLFSVNEVAGKQNNNNLSDFEGSKYAAFTSASSREKKLSNGSGSVRVWWLRSPELIGTQSFFIVYNGGSVDYTNFASATNGVCFGFCI